MSKQAYESLKAALEGAVRKYKRLDQHDLVQAMVEAINEANIDFEPTETMGGLLQHLAEQGSIDAVAMMVCAGFTEDAVKAGLRAVTNRSEDVMDGLQVEALTIMFEEWAEEEVAAGRMVKTVCPKTGVNLYGSVEKPK